jgi:hypothetical protein
VGTHGFQRLALTYLCGHFNRQGSRTCSWYLNEIRAVGEARPCQPPCISTSSPAHNASRSRAGEQAESESLGAVNSGDPATLEQFLLWAFDACPARRYVLVMAGLGIMDSDSVVGVPVRRRPLVRDLRRPRDE